MKVGLLVDLKVVWRVGMMADQLAGCWGDLRVEKRVALLVF